MKKFIPSPWKYHPTKEYYSYPIPSQGMNPALAPRITFNEDNILSVSLWERSPHFIDVSATQRLISSKLRSLFGKKAIGEYRCILIVGDSVKSKKFNEAVYSVEYYTILKELPTPEEIEALRAYCDQNVPLDFENLDFKAIEKQYGTSYMQGLKAKSKHGLTQ